MADALIDVVSVEELPTVVDLYNQIFRPTRPLESFQRRYLGRHNILQMVARVDDKPVGFFLGFELKPDTFFAWFYGVMPDFRRMSIGSQLMEAAQSWAAQNGYESIRLECHNLHRPMMAAILRRPRGVVCPTPTISSTTTTHSIKGIELLVDSNEDQ